mgnify:CR=1 FL=1
MELLKNIIIYALLGFIQGFSEPIPISSSGHLVIFQSIFEKTGLIVTQMNDVTFEVIVNTGSLLAIMFYYREDLIRLITSFFTYIGNDDHKAREGLEVIFSGSAPSRVTFNYYLKGNGEHKYSYDLNFDSSKEFHNYGFRWTSESIIYFVDEKPIYITNKSPSNKARIYLNNYTESNSIIGWIDKPSEEIKNDALVEWVSYKAID